MIRGAIFDIDGTLLDSMPIWDNAASLYLSSLGVEAEAELGSILFPMTLEEGACYLKERYSLPQPPSEIRAGVLRVIEDFYRYEAPLKPGAEQLLSALADRGIPMTLVTIGDRALAEAALERLGVLQYFAALFTARELNTTKREPLLYLTAAASMGTAPEETLVFEDVLPALKTAGTAGFVTVAIEDPASEADRLQILNTADYRLRFDGSDNIRGFCETVLL